MEWIPFGFALVAAVLVSVTQQIAATVVGFFVVFAVAIWQQGGPAPMEPLAAALVALAVASTMPSRVGRFWLGIALAGILWPMTGIASLFGASMVGVGLLGTLLGGSELDGRIPVGRFGSVLLIWLACLTLVEIALPSVALGGPVDALAASRSRLPLALALVCGLCCWPVHTIVLDACKRGAMGAPAVIPMLGLATLSELQLDPLIRGSAVGEVGILFVVVGLFTLLVGGMLSLAHEDLRFRLVAAQIGLAAWAATIWVQSAEAASVFWATAATASAVVGAVINRLELRYKSRERNSFSGLATRHPTAAVTLGFAGIVVAKVAVGPIAMAHGLPAVANLEPFCVVVVLVGGLIYAAAFGDVLRELLFGPPRVPEFRGEVFERVGKIGRDLGPIVGPTTLFAWGIPLLFVIVTSVASGTVLDEVKDRSNAPTVPPTVVPPAVMPLPERAVEPEGVDQPTEDTGSGVLE